MFDDIFDFDCDECGGSGPPPKFLIPPPPRPPYMQKLLNCRMDDDDDDDQINSSSYISSSSRRSSSDSKSSNKNNIFYSNSDINLDNSDMCEAIPILDASYHSSPSLQTSAMIAVFSLLLVLVVLISSLFVWKHKRKVQNFLPCKTVTRGPHIGGGITSHSVTYEEPDAHLGHRPLMMRQHHNVEMLSKTIHYPSGYPMTRSPPHLVCNSPGPDPYRSNDNVYEELDPTRGSDNESDGPQSDGDFAEDELSLPDDRNASKLSPESRSMIGPVSTIYHEQHSTRPLNCGIDQNFTLLSSNSAYNQRPKTNNSSNCSSTTNTTSRLGKLSGVFRNTTGRKSKNNSNVSETNQSESIRNRCQNHKTLPHNSDELSRLANDNVAGFRQPQSNAVNTQSDVVIPSTQLIYDDATSRNNLTRLAYNHSNNKSFPSTINSSNIIDTNRLNNLHNHSYKTLDSEVERRNRINQLHHTPVGIPHIATIFSERVAAGGTIGERINYGSCRYPIPYYTSQPNSLLSIQRSRTNPRSLDRRRIITSANMDEPNYGYAEPVYHEGLLYGLADNNNAATAITNNTNIPRQAYPSYVLPDYNTSMRTTNTSAIQAIGNNHNHYQSYNQQQQPPPTQFYYNSRLPQDLNLQHQSQQYYSRDSSFGSDSGYSQQTSSSLGPNRTNMCSNVNQTMNSNGLRIPTPYGTPSNLSLPSSDSGCPTNGPNSLTSIKLPPPQYNCDKENSNNVNSSSSTSYGWARTRNANLNLNYKKFKDNNATQKQFQLDAATTTPPLSVASSNIGPTLVEAPKNKTLKSPKLIEQVNGGHRPVSSVESDCEAQQQQQQHHHQQQQQIENHKNFNNIHSSSYLSSSPNSINNISNTSTTNNNCNNNGYINNSLINNNIINNHCSDLNETNRTVNNNSDSNNCSFNSVNNHNSSNSNNNNNSNISSSCKSQS